MSSSRPVPTTKVDAAMLRQVAHAILGMLSDQLVRLGALILIVLWLAACDSLATPGSPEATGTLASHLDSLGGRLGAGPTEEADSAGSHATPTSSESQATERSQASQALIPQLSHDNDAEFERISLEQGLSQSSVLSILQDSRGFMWFGTGDGLNRYDGYEFKVYKHDPADPHSLDRGAIQSIDEDQAGMIWIRKDSGSLDRYDRETDRFSHYDLFDPEDPDSASSDFIWTMYEDREGTVWVGTYQSGLHQYDREADRFVAYRQDPDDAHSLSSDRVYAIYEDREGVLWVGTRGGMNHLDRETGRFTRYQHDPNDPQSLATDIIQQIYEDRSGRFWVTSYGVGLEQFDRQTGRVIARYQHDPNDPQSIDRTDNIALIYEDQLGFLWIGHFDGRLDRLDPETGGFARFRHEPNDPQSLSDNVVSFVTEDQTGNLWIGTAGGLDRYDRETGNFVHYHNDPRDPHSLSGNTLLSFYEDRAGVLWIGTSGKGLNRFAPDRRKFNHYRIDPAAPDSVSNNVVYSILTDDEGTLWVGTNAGLNRFDSESGEFTQFRYSPADPQSLSPGWVSAIYQDQDGGLWIGTRGGLDKLDRATGSFTHYQRVASDDYTLSIGAIRSIWQDRAGVVWLGRHRTGLCKFDPDTGECIDYLYEPDDPLSPHNMITQVFEDGKGILWVGTEGGFHEFDRETETFTLYEHDPENPQSLNGNEIRSIYEDRAGALWVGTDGGGLNRFDRQTRTFTHYTEKDGLPSNSVYGILEDTQENLWISTGNGLSRFDPNAETFRNYDSGDGLQSNEFLFGAYHQSASGEMFFGGGNGFNAFFPERIQDNAHIPPVVLTSLTQGGEDVRVGQAVENVTEITFRWPNNFFEFEIAALGYSRPERNQYAYMLEGLDRNWNLAGTRRFGKYTNLPGGTYKLRLKGSNNDGVWNDEGISITVTIVPPFWDTWWFRGIAALVLIGSVIGGYRLRVRGVEARSRALEALVEERTDALERRTAELEERTQEIELRRHELEALYRADEELYSHLQLDEVLQALVDIAVDILKADKSSVICWDDAGEQLAIRVARGFSPEGIAQLTFAWDEGLVGHVFASGLPALSEDAAVDPRREAERPEIVAAVSAEGIHSFMHLPIKVDDRVFGVFNINFTKPHAFGQDEKRLFLALAQRAAQAIENAQLHQRTQDLAVVEERSRLARDLHDAVTQTLFSASLIAEALPELWEQDQEEGHELLGELRQLNRGALAEMRTLLLELRPAALVESNLGDLLRQVAEAITGRTGVPVTVTVEGPCALSSDVHVALYRIAQEALNNVVKHAGASQVTVRLRCTTHPTDIDREWVKRVELQVSDDGRGFDPGSIPPDRLGLGIIRERAQAIGATLDIASEIGAGTRILVVWEGDR